MSNHKPRVVALLPMKANSVRVAGKNFRTFCGAAVPLDPVQQAVSIED